MTYKSLVNIINFLIKVANKIRLVKCASEDKCLCAFCSKTDCKYNIHIDNLIGE